MKSPRGHAVSPLLKYNGITLVLKTVLNVQFVWCCHKSNSVFKNVWVSSRSHSKQCFSVKLTWKPLFHNQME